MEYRVIGDDGKEYGPVDLAQVKDWAAQGRVSPSSLVFRSDTGRWAHAVNYEELSGSLGRSAGNQVLQNVSSTPSSTGVAGPSVTGQGSGTSGTAVSYHTDAVLERTAETQAANVQTRTFMPGRGSTVLVLGIVSIVGSFLFSCACIGFVIGPALGIPAWIMGAGDLKRIAMGLINPSEAKNTRAGMICGIIGTFFGPVISVIVTVSAFFQLFSGMFFE